MWFHLRNGKLISIRQDAIVLARREPEEELLDGKIVEYTPEVSLPKQECIFQFNAHHPWLEVGKTRFVFQSTEDAQGFRDLLLEKFPGATQGNTSRIRH